MSAAVFNADHRPAIGSTFLPVDNGEVVTVAATWCGGVVFDERELAPSWDELMTGFVMVGGES